MRLALLHASKNEDVSHEIIIYIKSAELSSKTMSPNSPTSFSLDSYDSFVKTELISISAETLLKNTFALFRPSKWTWYFWVNVSAPGHKQKSHKNAQAGIRVHVRSHTCKIEVLSKHRPVSHWVLLHAFWSQIARRSTLVPNSTQSKHNKRSWWQR